MEHVSTAPSLKWLPGRAWINSATVAFLGATALFLALLALHQALPAIAIEYIALAALAWRYPRAAVWMLAIVLPLHTLLMTVFYIDFGVQAKWVTAIAAWKEVLIFLLLGVLALKEFSKGGLGAIRRGRLLTLDWAALALGAYLLVLLVLPSVVHYAPVRSTITERIYGFKTYAPLLVCYGVGRLIALDFTWLKRTLVVLLAVGCITGIWAGIERFAFPPSAYVQMGYVRYLHDVANITYGQSNSVAGLNGNSISTNPGGVLGALNGLLGLTHSGTQGPTGKPPWWALPSNFSTLGLPSDFATSIGAFQIRRAVSTYLSSQVLAISYFVLIPLALPALWLFRRKRTWVILAIAGMTLGLLLSLSRGPILSVLLACAIYGGALLADANRLGAGRGWQALRTEMTTARGRLVAIGVAAVVVVGLIATSPVTVPYLISAVTLQDHSVREHIVSIENGLALVGQHLWLGLGLGTSGVNATRFNLPPASAENQYVLLALETGLVGLALYIWFLAAAMIRTWRNWTTPGERFWRLMNLSMFAVLVAVVVDSLSAPVLNAWITTDLVALLLGICLQGPKAFAESRSTVGHSEADLAASTAATPQQVVVPADADASGTMLA